MAVQITMRVFLTRARLTPAAEPRFARARDGGRTGLVNAEPHRHELKHDRDRPIDGLEHERRQDGRPDTGNETEHEPDLDDGGCMVAQLEQDHWQDLARMARDEAEDAIASLPDVRQPFAQIACRDPMAHQPLDKAAHDSPSRRDDPGTRNGPSADAKSAARQTILSERGSVNVSSRAAVPVVIIRAAVAL